MSRQIDRLAQAIVRQIASAPSPRRAPANRLAATVASAVASRISARAPAPARKPPGNLASVVASAVARRISGAPARKPVGLAAAVASAVSARLGIAAQGAAAAPERTLVASSIASSVARQVASRTLTTPIATGTKLASLDPAKVAAAVVAQIEARKAKAADHSTVLASQIVQRLANARLQGSAPDASQFATQLASAVVDAIAQQQARPAADQSTATPEQPPQQDAPAAADDKSGARSKKGSVIQIRPASALCSQAPRPALRRGGRTRPPACGLPRQLMARNLRLGGGVFGKCRR